MLKLVGLVPLLLVAACSMNGQQESILQRNGTRVPVESADVANAALLPDPNIRSETHLAAGRLLQANGKLAGAIEQYQKAIAASPNNFEAQHKLGLLLGILARHDEAEENLRRAIALNPDSAVARNDLGFAYVRRHKWERAEFELRRAIALQPEFPRARVNLALVVAARGGYDEALSLFRDVLPKPDAYYNLGLTYRAHGRFDDAREAFSQVLALRPDFEAARRQIQNLPKRKAKRLSRKVPGGIETADEAIQAVAAAFVPDDFLVSDAPPGDLWDELKRSLEFGRVSSEPISVPPANVSWPPSTHEADADEDVDQESVTPADSIVQPFVTSVVEGSESANAPQGEVHDVFVADPVNSNPSTGLDQVITAAADETDAPPPDDLKPNVASEMQTVAASPGDNARQDTADEDTDDPQSSVDDPVSPTSEEVSSPAATVQPHEFVDQEDIKPANPIEAPSRTSKEDEFEAAAPDLDTAAPRNQHHNVARETRPVMTAKLDILQEPSEPALADEVLAERESHEEQQESPPSEIAALTEASAGESMSKSGEESPDDLLQETSDEDASAAESATEDVPPPLPMPRTDDLIAAHGSGDSLRRAPAVANVPDQAPRTSKKPVPAPLRNGIDAGAKAAEVGDGDFDRDGDVDLDDFASFRACFGGAGKAVEKDCYPGDFDGDGDVDLLDYRAFQVALTSP